MQEKTATLTPSWELVPKSWELLRKNYVQAIIFGLLPPLTLELGALLLRNSNYAGFFVYLLGVVWLGVTAPALYLFQITAVRGKSFGTAELYRRGLHYFWRILGYTLVISVIVLLGLLALVVPGLIFIRRYILGAFLIVDKDMRIGEAMQASAALTKPVAGYIWGTVGVFLACSIGTSIAATLMLSWIPDGASIASAVLSLAFMFILALRYAELAKKFKPAASSAS